MSTIHKEIDIDAPIERVFEVCDSPEAVALFAPGVVEVTAVTRTEGRIGDSFKATYALLGTRQEQLFTYVEYVKPRLITVRFEGDTTGTTRCRLTETTEGTRLRLDTDYEVPGGAIGRAVNSLLFESMDQNDASRMLESMKLNMERRAA